MRLKHELTDSVTVAAKHIYVVSEQLSAQHNHQTQKHWKSNSPPSITSEDIGITYSTPD